MFICKPIAMFLTAALLFSPQFCGAYESEEGRENDNITREDVINAIELHLAADDPLFKEFAQNRAMIVKHPEIAGPLVMDRVLSAEDRVELSRATNLLIDMGYDAEKIRTALKKVMTRALNLKDKGEAKPILSNVAQAFAKIGTPEDADALLPLLNHPEWIVQINAVRALGEIADAEAVPKIEQALEQHAQKMSADELRQDLRSERKEYSFLHEGFQAIAKIKYRTLLQKQLKAEPAA